MHFGFGWELSNVDLWNIDLLDTHLDLLDIDIPSKYFLCLYNVFKTTSTFVFKKSSRRLERRKIVTPSRFFGRRKIVTLKTCWRRLQDMSWRRLQDVLKINKCLLGRCSLKEVFWKTQGAVTWRCSVKRYS